MFWLNTAFFGSILAGIICGMMLARLKEPVAGKILIFMVCVPVLALLSVAFCGVGCSVIGVGLR